MSWTEDQKQKAITWWREGQTASEIARRLGGEKTRNAVLGVLSRRGVLGTVSHSKNPQPQRRPLSVAAKKAKAEKRKRAVEARFEMQRAINKAKGNVSTPLDYDVASTAAQFRHNAEEDRKLFTEKNVTFGDLEAHHCRWPIGDPLRSEFVFCGCDHIPASPYCERHTKRAFAPPERKPRGKNHNDGVRVPSLEIVK